MHDVIMMLYYLLSNKQTKKIEEKKITFGWAVANDWSEVILEADTGSLVSKIDFNSLSKSVLSQLSVIFFFFCLKKGKEKKGF